jgi:phenylalanyl-tRNA synthetase beta chain
VDLAFVVPLGLPAHHVTAVLSQGDPLVVDVTLFDVFHSDALGPDARSLTFSVRLQAADRTLTDAEVAEARAGLISGVEALGAKLRG